MRNLVLRQFLVLGITMIFVFGLNLFSAVQAFDLNLPGSSKINNVDISGDFKDANFKQAVWEWLGNSGTPGQFTRQDIIKRLPGKSYILDVSEDKITSLEGVGHFEGVQRLYCIGNELTSLPDLPDTLVHFSCSDNLMKSLPGLPANLQRLNCSKNALRSLPALPLGLKGLDCSENQLSSLPALPTDIEELHCENNKLLSLPKLPSKLVVLVCSENRLTDLPVLPNELGLLACSDNEINDLNELPDRLQVLLCNNNQLNSLPVLPTGLAELECNNNQLSNLPALPSNMSKLDCTKNFLNVFSGELRNRIVACAADQTSVTPQYRIRYIGSDIQLGSGDIQQLISSVLKKQMSSDGSSWDAVKSVEFSDMTFSSSDNTIAKVDSKGLITAKGAGTCSIFAMWVDTDSEFTKAIIAVEVSGEAGDDGILPNLTEPQQEQDGMDITSASSWAVEELEKAEEYGLVTEKVQQSLKQDITREEFCGIAVKLYEALSNKQAVPAIVNPFNDTSDLDILKAYELGIVKGVSSDKFAPGNNITRQEICVMIYRALKASKPNLDYTVTNIEAFEDEGQIASWAINEVRYASKNNIMKGTGGNCISPLNNTSREQGIVLVKRTYEGFENK